MELDASISAIITGIVIPFIMPLILQTRWSSKVKQLITFGMALVLGFVNMLITKQGADILAVLTATVVVYQSLNKTGLFDTIGSKTDLIPKIDTVPEPEEGYVAGEGE